MAATGGERVGVLVLRIWVEGPDRDADLRARITATTDVARPDVKEETLPCAGVEETCSTVCRWVTRFAGHAAPMEPGAA
jgi:hypothetical protein